MFFGILFHRAKLQDLNGRPPSPMRSCRKRMGLPTPAKWRAPQSMIGRVTSSSTNETNTSTIRLRRARAWTYENLRKGSSSSGTNIPNDPPIDLFADGVRILPPYAANFKCKAPVAESDAPLFEREYDAHRSFRERLSFQGPCSPMIPDFTKDFPIIFPARREKPTTFRCSSGR